MMSLAAMVVLGYRLAKLGLSVTRGYEIVVKYALKREMLARKF